MQYGYTVSHDDHTKPIVMMLHVISNLNFHYKEYERNGQKRYSVDTPVAAAVAPFWPEQPSLLQQTSTLTQGQACQVCVPT